MKRKATDRSRTWRRMMDVHSAQERARREAHAAQAAESRAKFENLCSSTPANRSESKDKPL